MTDSQESNESNAHNVPTSPVEPPQTPPASYFPRGRLVGLIAIVLFLFLSSYISLRGSQPTQADDSTRLYIDTLFQARELYTRLHVSQTPDPAGNPPRPSDTVRLLGDLQQLVGMRPTPQGPHFLRILAVMQAAFGDEGWRQSFLRLPEVSPPGATWETERELALWKAAFDPAQTVSTAQEADRLATGIRSKNLGWYEHLALEQMYHRRGMESEAQHESQAALRSTSHLYGLTAFGIMTVLGGLFLWFSLFMYYRGRRHEIAAFGASDLAPFAATPLLRLDKPQSDALYIVFVSYLFSYAAIRLGLMAFSGFAQSLSPTGMRLFSLALSLLMLLPPLLAFLALGMRRGLRWEDIGFRSDNRAVDVLWGVGGYAMALPLLFATNLFSSLLFRGIRSPSHPVLMELAGSHGLFYQMLLFSQVSLLPAFIEETMFRGVFFRSLSVRLGAARGMLLASAIFSILHPQLPLGFLSIFTLGLVFNLMYYKRGSLLPCIITHALNNGIIFLYFTLLVSK